MNSMCLVYVPMQYLLIYLTERSHEGSVIKGFEIFLPKLTKDYNLYNSNVYNEGTVIV